jgi:hypothetical protein
LRKPNQISGIEALRQPLQQRVNVLFSDGPIFALPHSSLRHLDNLSKPFERSSFFWDLAQRKLVYPPFDYAD